MYNPIREGCRGGRDLFKWNDVRLMPAKDRECYLGSSVKLGYLDRGGRWRKKDWWQKYDPKADSKIKDELTAIKEKELLAYKEKLGIVKPKKTTEAPHVKELTPQEMQEVLSRKYDNDNEITKADRVRGLGFEKKLANYRKEDDYLKDNDPTLNRLEAVGLDASLSKKEPPNTKGEKLSKEVKEKKRNEPRERKRSRSRDRHNGHHHRHKHH